MNARLPKLFFAVALAAVSGCAAYRWTSDVPQHLRTVAVPTFENRTMSAELGPIVTQYVLREFQREGTFKIKRTGDSAIEVQGALVKATRGGLAFDRGHGYRASEYFYRVTAEVNFVNKKSGKVFLTRKYNVETTFLTQDDLLTGQRNAAPRIGQEIARQVVDDAVSFDYDADLPEGATGEVEGAQK